MLSSRPHNCWCVRAGSANKIADTLSNDIGRRGRTDMECARLTHPTQTYRRGATDTENRATQSVSNTCCAVLMI